MKVSNLYFTRQACAAKHDQLRWIRYLKKRPDPWTCGKEVLSDSSKRLSAQTLSQAFRMPEKQDAKDD